MLSVEDVTFSRTPQGFLCIGFKDAVFVRADCVFIDPATRMLSGLLGQMHFHIGTVDRDLAHGFMTEDSVLLTAPHPQGHEVALLAPLQTLQ